MDETAKTPAALGADAGTPAPVDDLVVLLSQKVVGQPAAVQCIVPYVYMFQAGLAPEGRPAGVFLLLGPTGTGKTRTVEAIAEILHGSAKNLVKIDCGEFQMEHEVAKAHRLATWISGASRNRANAHAATVTGGDQ
jgi:ATP-dependent Clp protease ATP-binding subunit ClpA